MSKIPARSAVALKNLFPACEPPSQAEQAKRAASAKSRVMYIESKAGSLTGPARIGRVTFNRTGRTIFYRDHVFRRIVGGGFKSNYYDAATGDDYWISGCKRRGGDSLYSSSVPIEIDEDVRAEYWRDIRGQPERANEKTA